MRRRDFVRLLGAAVAWPLVARAQQPSTPKVGYVWFGERSRDVSGAGLRQELVDKGYEIGRNLVFEERYAHGDIEKVPALIAELLALKVDVLVTVGTSISLAARRARPQRCQSFAYPVIQSARVSWLACRGREATSPGSRCLRLTTAQSGWNC